MATDIALDSNDDLWFDGVNFGLVKGTLETVQSSKIRLRFIQTEWVYDFTIGIPWFDEMFDVQVPKERKQQILVSTLQNTVGVNKILQFAFDVDRENRGALIEYEIETIFGETAQIGVEL